MYTAEATTTNQRGCALPGHLETTIHPQATSISSMNTQAMPHPSIDKATNHVQLWCEMSAALLAIDTWEEGVFPPSCWRRMPRLWKDSFAFVWVTVNHFNPHSSGSKTRKNLPAASSSHQCTISFAFWLWRIIWKATGLTFKFTAVFYLVWMNAFVAPLLSCIFFTVLLTISPLFSPQFLPSLGI